MIGEYAARASECDISRTIEISRFWITSRVIGRRPSLVSTSNERHTCDRCASARSSSGSRSTAAVPMRDRGPGATAVRTAARGMRVMATEASVVELGSTRATKDHHVRRRNQARRRPDHARVIQNRLISIVREMSHSLARAGVLADSSTRSRTSPTCYSVRMASCRTGRGIPVFLGAMTPVLQAVLERYPVAGDRPRRRVHLQRSVHGLRHAQEHVNVVRPIFADDELVLFAVCKAHWTDIGARSRQLVARRDERLPGGRQHFRRCAWRHPARSTPSCSRWCSPIRVCAPAMKAISSLNSVPVHVAEERVGELLKDHPWIGSIAYISSLLGLRRGAGRARRSGRSRTASTGGGLGRSTASWTSPSGSRFASPSRRRDSRSTSGLSRATLRRLR